MGNALGGHACALCSCVLCVHHWNEIHTYCTLVSGTFLMFQSFPMNLLFALVIIWRGRGGGGKGIGFSLPCGLSLGNVI